MERRNLSGAGLSTPPIQYSHGVLATAPQAILTTSGQVAIRADGSIPEGIEAQLELIFQNIESILVDGGFTMADVVQARTFLTDADQLRASRAAFTKWLGSAQPASTLVIVKSLISPAFLAEVEVMAVR